MAENLFSDPEINRQIEASILRLQAKSLEWDENPDGRSFDDFIVETLVKGLDAHAEAYLCKVDREDLIGRYGDYLRKVGAAQVRNAEQRSHLKDPYSEDRLRKMAENTGSIICRRHELTPEQYEAEVRAEVERCRSYSMPEAKKWHEWYCQILNRIETRFEARYRHWAAEAIERVQRESKARASKPADLSLIGRLPKEALVRMEAATAAFMAGYLPKLEREANKSGPIHDAELLRELVIHQFNLVARECLAVCISPEEFEAELRSDIARFVRYGLSQYPWLAEPMLKELDTGFAFFVMGVNPWAEIPEADRASAWHVGAITGEALTHAALHLRAEAWARAAEGGFPTPDEAGATEPGGGNPNGTDAGPAGNGADPTESDSTGRKRGPKPDHETALRVAEVVARIAPDGDWRPKLDDICEALDEAQIPFPPRWRKRDRSCYGWAAYDERANAVKAIEYRLEIAKQRKKTTPETLS
jgi:hypothetical protein